MSWWDWIPWWRPRPNPVPVPPPAPLPVPTPGVRPPLPPEVRGDGSNACANKPAWASAAVVLGSCIQLKGFPPGEVEIAWLQIECLDDSGRMIASAMTIGRDIYGETGTRYPTLWGIGGKGNVVGDWGSRELRDNNLIIRPSTQPDRLFHFYGRKVTLAGGTKKIRTSAKLRITGGALLSIGSDWWRSVHNTSSVWGPCNSTDPRTTNTDGPQSPWHSFEHGDWFTITVNA